MLGTIMHCDFIKGLWDALNLIYGHAKNNSRLCQLYRQSLIKGKMDAPYTTTFSR